jgi:hypothetical protein
MIGIIGSKEPARDGLFVKNLTAALFERLSEAQGLIA